MIDLNNLKMKMFKVLFLFSVLIITSCSFNKKKKNKQVKTKLKKINIEIKATELSNDTVYLKSNFYGEWNVYLIDSSNNNIKDSVGLFMFNSDQVILDLLSYDTNNNIEVKNDTFFIISPKSQFNGTYKILINKIFNKKIDEFTLCSDNSSFYLERFKYDN